MSVYSDKNIYGFSWYIYNEYGEFIKKFEKIYPERIGFLQIQEIKKEYYKLTRNQLNYAKFKIYTCCTTTYNLNFNNEYGTFMCWYPVSKKIVKNILI
jgi:uncharacterized protein (DUF2344 family)